MSMFGCFPLSLCPLAGRLKLLEDFDGADCGRFLESFESLQGLALDFLDLTPFLFFSIPLGLLKSLFKSGLFKSASDTHFDFSWLLRECSVLEGEAVFGRERRCLDFDLRFLPLY